MSVSFHSRAIPDAERVLIADATLSYGQVGIGCRMTQLERLLVARALAELGVDVIEAGVPGASRDERESVIDIARGVHGPIIAGLARCSREDIELTAEALREAPRRRINVVLATGALRFRARSSVVHANILRSAVEGVETARSLCEDVEVSAIYVSHTDWEFLAQVVEATVEAGARTVNISDSVGYIVPEEFAELIRYLRNNVRGIGGVRLSISCRDGLGIAVANSLSAIIAGARQVECTMNGKQAGGCALEVLIMALKTREAFFNVTTGVHADRLYSTSQLISQITGVPIPRILRPYNGSLPRPRDA
jgi:2-isopropylmalate synthase